MMKNNDTQIIDSIKALMYKEKPNLQEVSNILDKVDRNAKKTVIDSIGADILITAAGQGDVALMKKILDNTRDSKQMDEMIHFCGDLAIRSAVANRDTAAANTLFEYASDPIKKQQMFYNGYTKQLLIQDMFKKYSLFEELTEEIVDKEKILTSLDDEKLSQKALMIILAYMPESVSNDKIKEYYDKYSNDKTNIEKDLDLISKMREFKKANSEKQVHELFYKDSEHTTSVSQDNGINIDERVTSIQKILINGKNASDLSKVEKLFQSSKIDDQIRSASGRS